MHVKDKTMSENRISNLSFMLHSYTVSKQQRNMLKCKTK